MRPKQGPFCKSLIDRSNQSVARRNRNTSSAHRYKPLARSRTKLSVVLVPAWSDPYSVVMECCAAIGRDRIGPGECVDTAAIRIGVVRPDRLGDQHAAAHPCEDASVNLDFAASVAEHDRLAIGDSGGCRVVGMDHDFGPP